MLLDIFVLPSSGRFISESGLQRLIKTVSVDERICRTYTKVTDFADINKQYKSTPFYGVFYDNEYIDPRLVKSLKTFLVYSRNIDMFSVFIYTMGSPNILFQPRIFMTQHKLDPNKKEMPLPANEKMLTSEKILNGWVYRD